jgi:hypothetical protein
VVWHPGFEDYVRRIEEEGTVPNIAVAGMIFDSLVK